MSRHQIGQDRNLYRVWVWPSVDLFLHCDDGLTKGAFSFLSPVRHHIVTQQGVCAACQRVPARIVRGEFLRLKYRDFVLAAENFAVGHSRIMSRHILPNTVSLIIVQGKLLVAYAIVTESGLSYLGFGVQPPTPSWDNLLATAWTYALRAPWLMIFPGLMIFITSMSINCIGDGMRDVFDPYSVR